MFMNIDRVPEGHRLFTIHVGTAEMTDEVDVVAPMRYGNAKQVQAVMEKALEELKAGYEGQKIQGIVDQSTAHIVFSTGWEHFYPLPIEPSKDRLALSDDDAGPWEYLYTLMDDNFHGQHDPYLEFLLGGLQ